MSLRALVYPPEEAFTSVGASVDYSCGIKTDGTIACWRNRPRTGDGTAFNPPAVDFASFSFSVKDAACGVTKDGAIVCWGNTNLGDSVPEGTFESVTLGETGACGLRTDGAGICWGSANYITLAVENRPKGYTWCEGADVANEGECWVFDQYEFKSFSRPSHYRVCGVDVEGYLRCWPSKPPGFHYVSLQAEDQARSWIGDRCAVSDSGAPFCWPMSFQGVLPAGLTSTFESVAVRGRVACAEISDGTSACWNSLSGEDQLLRPEDGFKAIAGSSTHYCGLSQDGSVTCWGSGYDMVDPPEGVYVSIVAGEDHFCGIRDDGSIACWGGNAEGQ